jgi:hypothetical protein
MYALYLTDMSLQIKTLVWIETNQYTVYRLSWLFLYNYEISETNIKKKHVSVIFKYRYDEHLFDLRCDVIVNVFVMCSILDVIY